MNSFSKSLVTASMVLVGGAANASDLFYINTGNDYVADSYLVSPVLGDAAASINDSRVCLTCTGEKTALGIQYESQTTITSVGDVVTTGGVVYTGTNGVTTGISVFDEATQSDPTAGGNYSENQFDPLIPDDDNNGFDATLNGWGLSFSFSNLVGTVTGVDDAGLPLINYTSGTINLLYTEDNGTSYTNFMDLNVTSGVPGTNNLHLTGDVNFDDIDDDAGALKNLFHSADMLCGGDSSFFSIATNCSESSGSFMELSFTIDQNTETTNPPFVEVDYDGNGGTRLTGAHGGQLFYSVPEPASLALMGLGLLGFSAVSRKKI